MPSLSAKSVVFLLYPGVAALDVSGPAQAFGAANGTYQLRFISAASGETISSDCPGLRFTTDDDLSASNIDAIDTLIIPGGYGIEAAVKDCALVAAAQALAGRARRVATVCVGAFLAAEAGLFNGRKVATHWRACADLEDQYPTLAVEPNAIWQKDGRYWSSAGASAGIDLALALIEEDLGGEVALDISRELVVFLRRPGGQLQFSRALAAQTADVAGPIGALMSWISENLDRDLTVDVLAERAGMSLRTFARTFRKATGATPAQAVEAMRIDAARAAVERSQATLGEIARRYGFGDEQNMRRAFIRRLGSPPQALRSLFTISRTPQERRTVDS